MYSVQGARIAVWSAAALVSRGLAVQAIHIRELDSVASCSSALAADDAYPQQYIAHFTPTPPTLDGRLDDALWQAVPWTQDFVDIADGPNPRKRTRAKMRWDHDFLYVGAWLEEDEIWANVTVDDEVTFHDNDFEVFVDAAGSTHYYKEFEMNAINQKWDLCLNKPYSNGGYENSSRTHGAHGYEMHARSAVHVEGEVNNAHAKNAAWSVEIALPMESLLVNQTGAEPSPGMFWRLGFSRVEWRVVREGGAFWKDPAYPHEDNWVWQPQGVVDMHRPERWGVLQFADEHVEAAQLVRDPSWPIRRAAAEVYDAQAAWAAEHGGHFTSSLERLEGVASSVSLLRGGACTHEPTVELSSSGEQFTARVSSTDGKLVATIREDRRLTIERH